MVVNDGEILEAAGMLSNPTTHISLGIWKPRNCSAYINWIAVQSFPQMNTSGSDIIACKLCGLKIPKILRRLMKKAILLIKWKLMFSKTLG